MRGPPEQAIYRHFPGWRNLKIGPSMGWIAGIPPKRSFRRVGGSTQPMFSAMQFVILAGLFVSIPFALAVLPITRSVYSPGTAFADRVGTAFISGALLCVCCAFRLLFGSGGIQIGPRTAARKRSSASTPLAGSPSRVELLLPHVEEIGRSIRTLHRAFGRKPIFLDRPSLCPTQQLLRASDLSEWGSQFVAKDIAAHLGLLVGPIVVSHQRIGGNRVGYAERTHRYTKFVAIDERCTDALGRAAVLAHEITHLFLWQHGVEFSDKLENEILTDTAATYFGLGVLILNGFTADCRPTGATPGTNTRLLGYITPAEFGYVLAKRALRFDERPNRLLKTELGLEGYRAGMKHLKAERRAAAKGCVFRCPGCRQRIRVPPRLSRGVSCPTCSHKFSHRSW
jgi:hypothetical protein